MVQETPRAEAEAISCGNQISGEIAPGKLASVASQAYRAVKAPENDPGKVYVTTDSEGRSMNVRWRTIG